MQRTVSTERAVAKGRHRSADEPALAPGVRDLLREAVWWRLLGRLFECPDDPWRRDIRRLAGETCDPELRGAADLALATAAEGPYHSVFGPGGPAPPREVSYRDRLELGSLMSELAAYYEAFGYRPLTWETPDHVSVEAGFVSYLRAKEAYALMAGDIERAAITAGAASRFVADHVATVATPLARLLAGAGIDYLARASRRLAARAGPPPSRARLPVVAEVEDGTEFGCVGI
jgi:nitrate reductase assembly molybdenum cofactor insertion protein NarJ